MFHIPNCCFHWADVIHKYLWVNWTLSFQNLRSTWLNRFKILGQPGSNEKGANRHRSYWGTITGTTILHISYITTWSKTMSDDPHDLLCFSFTNEKKCKNQCVDSFGKRRKGLIGALKFCPVQKKRWLFHRKNNWGNFECIVELSCWICYSCLVCPVI